MCECTAKYLPKNQPHHVTALLLCNTPLLKSTPPLQFNEHPIKTYDVFNDMCKGGRVLLSLGLIDHWPVSQCEQLIGSILNSCPDQSGYKGTNTSIITSGFELKREETISVNMYKAIKIHDSSINSLLPVNVKLKLMQCNTEALQ